MAMTAIVGLPQHIARYYKATGFIMGENCFKLFLDNKIMSENRFKLFVDDKIIVSE